MTEKDFEDKYNLLFSIEDKAAAFDKIARMFYFGNFGTVQKSELELLLFSEYLEKILRREEDNVNAYSDYTLSKCFGISQQRISNLKVKKSFDIHTKNLTGKNLFSVFFQKPA